MGVGVKFRRGSIDFGRSFYEFWAFVSGTDSFEVGWKPIPKLVNYSEHITRSHLNRLHNVDERNWHWYQRRYCEFEKAAAHHVDCIYCSVWPSATRTKVGQLRNLMRPLSRVVVNLLLRLNTVTNPQDYTVSFVFLCWNNHCRLLVYSGLQLICNL